MKRVFVALAALALWCSGVAAQAVSMQTVLVGDPGNSAYTQYETPGYGSVAYTYNIGKYEVTAAQYCDFLNNKAKTDTYGLYNASMSNSVIGIGGCNIQRSGSVGSYAYSVASDWANRPVNYVSYWDSCRFANWLNNGQGDGDTENGAYTLGGYTGRDGHTIARNTGAKWCLTSADEWSKAAYYKGGSANAGYWQYPTKTNSINTGMANYDLSVWYTTNVGSYTQSSAYGTFDQAGNVWEWNEAVTYDGYGYRSILGGSFSENDPSAIDSQVSTHGFRWQPSYETYNIGFRLAYMPEGWQPVPEPSSLMALSVGGLALLLGRRRRRG